jgi:hypothetical protein
MLANVSLGVPTLTLILCRLPQIEASRSYADFTQIKTGSHRLKRDSLGLVEHRE